MVSSELVTIANRMRIPNKQSPSLTTFRYPRDRHVKAHSPTFTRAHEALEFVNFFGFQDVVSKFLHVSALEQETPSQAASRCDTCVGHWISLDNGIVELKNHDKAHGISNADDVQLCVSCNILLYNNDAALQHQECVTSPTPRITLGYQHVHFGMLCGDIPLDFNRTYLQQNRALDVFLIFFPSEGVLGAYQIKVQGFSRVQKSGLYSILHGVPSQTPKLSGLYPKQSNKSDNWMSSLPAVERFNSDLLTDTMDQWVSFDEAKRLAKQWGAYDALAPLWDTELTTTPSLEFFDRVHPVLNCSLCDGLVPHARDLVGGHKKKCPGGAKHVGTNTAAPDAGE